MGDEKKLHTCTTGYLVEYNCNRIAGGLVKNAEFYLNLTETKVMILPRVKWPLFECKTS